MDKLTPVGENFRSTGNWRHWNWRPRARHAPIVWRRAATTRPGNECHSLTHSLPALGQMPPASDPDRPASSADILTFKANDNPELGFVGYVV